MMTTASKGVIYIAVGPDYTRQAVQSAESVRQWAPELAVHLFTDQPDVTSPAVNGITRIENPHNRSKVDYIHRTPFARTLYLDADTRVVADIRGMFDVLDRFELAIAHAHKRNHFPTNQPWRIPIPDAFPQMNGGVLLFRAEPRVLGLLQDWQRAYHESGFTKDQVTLRELLWLSDLRIAILPPEYNLRYEKYLEVWTEHEAKPHILHMRQFKGSDRDTRKKTVPFAHKMQRRVQKLVWLWKQLRSSE